MPDSTSPLQNGPLAWGRTLHAAHHLFSLHDRSASLPDLSPCLPFGNGRSYGDVALNPNGTLLLTRGLDRFIRFDPIAGILECEAGVLLDDILTLIVPHGWFLPVTPGTRFVTVGGAIANDVHGKNHHRLGCFSRHVLNLELLRSTGERFTCSPDEKSEWFAASCGGLGLTGLITQATLKLRPIHNPWMLGFQTRFEGLDDFFELSHQADTDYEYSVAWVDCAALGRRLGRGIFMAANHAPADFKPRTPPPPQHTLPFPFTPPFSLVTPLTLRAFNTAYFHRIPAGQQPLLQHFQPFFYPLDGLLNWNRLYGPRGFHQYQCVLPDTPKRSAQAAIAALLDTISKSGQGSFLAVLKICGDIPSPATLSFPQPGISLALDFPERGAQLSALFERLDAEVAYQGGRLYPAKDSRMPASLFQSGYPNWKSLEHYRDPAFSSAFWQRVSSPS